MASLLYSKETNYDPTFGGLRKGVWIGLSGYKTSEGNVKWKWQDDFPVMFTRWGLNQPNLEDVNLEPSKSCVYIDKGDLSYWVTLQVQMNENRRSANVNGLKKLKLDGLL